MSPDQMAPVLSAWATGTPPDDQTLARLKEEYLSQLGTSTCTSCPHWKEDMFFHFRAQLKALNLFAMAAKTKYMIAPSVGSFYVAGIGLLVNTHNAVAGTIALTDQIGDDLLARGGDYENHILVNPDYVAPEPVAKAETGKKKDEDAK